jgi:hypothetical protein
MLHCSQHLLQPHHLSIDVAEASPLSVDQVLHESQQQKMSSIFGAAHRVESELAMSVWECFLGGFLILDSFECMRQGIILGIVSHPCLVNLEMLPIDYHEVLI